MLGSFATNPADINKNDLVQDFLQGRSWNEGSVNHSEGLCILNRPPA